MNTETKNTCYTHNVSLDAIATVHMYPYPHLLSYNHAPVLVRDLDNL